MVIILPFVSTSVPAPPLIVMLPLLPFIAVTAPVVSSLAVSAYNAYGAETSAVRGESSPAPSTVTPSQYCLSNCSELSDVCDPIITEKTPPESAV